MVFTVPASPYTPWVVPPGSPDSDYAPAFEGSRVFRDSLANLYGASFTESAINNGIDANLNGHDVSAIILGSHWELAAPPLPVAYPASDYCGDPAPKSKADTLATFKCVASTTRT